MPRSAGGNWRFRLLLIGFFGIALVLCLRLFSVQVIQHEHYEARAIVQWQSPVTLVPERGNLYDRYERPLALSVKSWRVGVSGCLIRGNYGAESTARDEAREVAQVLAEVLNQPQAALLQRIRAAGKNHVVLAKEIVLGKEARTRLESYPAITGDELRSRIYPLGGIGASLIGRFHADGASEHEVTTGLERSLAVHLAGQPGRALRLESPNRLEPRGNIVLEEAQHGSDLILTLDATLQEICEGELARSVHALGAQGGAVLIVDPACGDVLAAASWPLLADRSSGRHDQAVWNNFNFTSQYEPGSVFKVFTAASLLRHGAIDTATVFDCSDSDFGTFQIHNSDGHCSATYAFMDAFAQSCNVYFARAVANLDADEFYRELTEFGFGQKTSFPYQAQVPGILHTPATWSGRSKATIAIGQEVAVSPLQLALAVAAVANGGTLYAPRIVREVRGRDGQSIEHCPPMPLRRVMSASLAALLREAMRRVMTSGTGSEHDLSWIPTGGKTGTAQKCVDGRAYASGKYMASFVGCVPYDEPRLVILTILDEPPGVYHYAAQSAVPLFTSIVREIRKSTDWLTDVCSPVAAGKPVMPQRIAMVPDVMYLTATLAEQELHRAGFVAQGSGRQGLVIEQVPGPGAACLPGSSIRLTVSAGPAVAERSVCPDLRGQSQREVRGLAARLGVPLQIEGVGYVKHQEPPPGNRIGPDGIRVWLEKPWL